MSGGRRIGVSGKAGRDRGVPVQRWALIRSSGSPKPAHRRVCERPAVNVDIDPPDAEAYRTSVLINHVRATVMFRAGCCYATYLSCHGKSSLVRP